MKIIDYIIYKIISKSFLWLHGRGVILYRKGNFTIQPTIVPRAEHGISRQNINQNALKVMYGLKDAGFAAYLVGGGVRDLWLDLHPKDFDIVTNATPEEVRELFRNCRLIGRRFRLAHVHFGRDYVEVATFRGSHDSAECESHASVNAHGRILRDNVFGTLEEDAWRRDFTINALYYNIQDFSVVDYVGGLDDLNKRQIRLIGDPEKRYLEDPVRMLRAVRFAVKLGFDIDPATEAPIDRLRHHMNEIPPARLFDECLKLFLSGRARATYDELARHGLFRELFPDTAQCLGEPGDMAAQMLYQALDNTDARVAQDKPVTPAFLFACLLWEPVRQLMATLQAKGVNEAEAVFEASERICQQQLRIVALPKRFSIPMKEIWRLQARFRTRSGKRPFKLLTHPKFRAAYDFLLLRAHCGEVPQELADWWTRFQDVSDQEQQQMLLEAPASGGGNKKRRRRRKP